MDDIAALADSISKGVKELAEENAALRAEVARLREAIEWALDCGESFYSDDEGREVSLPETFKSELRRRAGEG